MAMNNSNYGYPPSGYSSPYSSTPTGIRAQRPRFGYSGPSLYPRPRSSASKPNPDSFSDSMINNYGTSASRIDSSFNSENGNSYSDTYNSTGSNYYSANDSFSHGQAYGDVPMMRNDMNMLRDNTGIRYDNSALMRNINYDAYDYSGIRPLPRNDVPSSGIFPKPASQFGPGKFNYNSTFGKNNTGEFKGNFTKNSNFGDKNKPVFARKFGKAKRMATTGIVGKALRCELCSLDFTSQIPYDMHIRGSKHAKKLKAKTALSAVQSQVDNTSVKSQDGEKSFFCELCNVKANSSLQLQTHLDGSKHKNKLQPKESKEAIPQEVGEKSEANTPVNGKTNGSLVRSLPSDFGEPQPSKLAKFACDVCNVSVNSEIQLQQHLTSKKHQNKLEGKPVIKGKRVKTENAATNDANVPAVETAEVKDDASNETSTKVVGVKTLASSFVQGETLH